MSDAVKQATEEICALLADHGFMFDDDEELDEVTKSLREILEEHFPTRQTTIDFTPAFNVSTNSTSSNSTPKENDLDRRKEETRYNSRNPKGRTEYTPRRDGDVRDKSK